MPESVTAPKSQSVAARPLDKVVTAGLEEIRIEGLRLQRVRVRKGRTWKRLSYGSNGVSGLYGFAAGSAGLAALSGAGVLERPEGAVALAVGGALVALGTRFRLSGNSQARFRSAEDWRALAEDAGVAAGLADPIARADAYEELRKRRRELAEKDRIGAGE